MTTNGDPMIEVLYCSYITDEANENGGLDFATKFANARTVSFVFTAHQGGNAPSTAGVKVEVEHSDDGNTYEPVPNAVLAFSSPGGQVASIVEVPPGTLKAFGKIVLAGTGMGDPAGAGSVTAVW